MQLTKLRAAPVRQAEVPPCAPGGRSDGGTASQLIPSVGWTQKGAAGVGVVLGSRRRTLSGQATFFREVRHRVRNRRNDGVEDTAVRLGDSRRLSCLS